MKCYEGEGAPAGASTAILGGSRALVGRAADRPPTLCAMRPLVEPTLSAHDGGRGVVIDRPPTRGPHAATPGAACCIRGVDRGVVLDEPPLPGRPDRLPAFPDRALTFRCCAPFRRVAVLPVSSCIRCCNLLCTRCFGAPGLVGVGASALAVVARCGMAGVVAYAISASTAGFCDQLSRRSAASTRARKSTSTITCTPSWMWLPELLAAELLVGAIAVAAAHGCTRAQRRRRDARNPLLGRRDLQYSWRMDVTVGLPTTKRFTFFCLCIPHTRFGPSCHFRGFALRSRAARARRAPTPHSAHPLALAPGDALR